MTEVSEVYGWKYFLKNNYHFKLSISKFKVNGILIFVNEN